MTGTLRQAAAGYLQTRRSLGYQLQAHGQLLNSYLADLEASGQTTVTAANAVAWATRPAGASAVWHSRRLSVARCFARYLSVTDPSCQVPPAWLLPARYSRVAPYIYTQQQISALVHAAYRHENRRSDRAHPRGRRPGPRDHHRRQRQARRQQVRPAAPHPHAHAPALRRAPEPALPGAAI